MNVGVVFPQVEIGQDPAMIAHRSASASPARSQSRAVSPSPYRTRYAAPQSPPGSTFRRPRSRKRGSSNADGVTIVWPVASACAMMPREIADRTPSISSSERRCAIHQRVRCPAS